jgi:two-component system, LytTR family, sensor kinase
MFSFCRGTVRELTGRLPRAAPPFNVAARPGDEKPLTSPPVAALLGDSPNRRSWRIALWTLPGLFGLAHASIASLASYHEPRMFLMPILWNVPIWYYWAIMLPVIARVVRRYPLTLSTWRASALPHLLVAIPLALLASAVVTALPLILDDESFGRVLDSYIGALNLRLLFDLVTYAAITLAITATSLWREAHERELRSAHLETELAHARLHALHSQLKPHFLFNSLNTIAMLMRIGRTPEALQLLTRYGRLLRTAIESDRHEWALGEEIAFMRRYLDLEQARFADRLTVEIHVDDAASHAIVPTFVLQPIVENALGHGLRHVEQGAVLRIRAERGADRLTITIDDNGAGLPADWSFEEDAGIGLTNTARRLAHAFGDAHQLTIERSEPGVVVTLTIAARALRTLDPEDRDG